MIRLMWFLSLVLICLIIFFKRHFKSEAPKMNRKKNEPANRDLDLFLIIWQLLLFFVSSLVSLLIPWIYIEIILLLILPKINEDFGVNTVTFAVIYMTLARPQGPTMVLELGNDRLMRNERKLVNCISFCFCILF